jgi:hypothetical protein
MGVRRMKRAKDADNVIQLRRKSYVAKLEHFTASGLEIGISGTWAGTSILP